MRINPLGGGTGDLGCVIEDVDCGCLSDSEFEEIEKALYTYKVVVVRGQESLEPSQQLCLNKRFDPNATSYGHANNSQREKRSILSKDGITVPSVPEVQILGNGALDVKSSTWYSGLEGAVMRHPTHDLFHRDHLSEEAVKEGKTRFYRWHIDAALYGLNPPLVTTLLGLDVPSGLRQTVCYDDGSGDELSVPLGGTAFVSGAAALLSLPPDLRSLALHSEVTYAPHPYTFIAKSKAHPTGLVCLSEGQEMPLDDLPEWDPSKLLRVPLVWTNPVTHEQSLQIHGACVWKLHLRQSADQAFRDEEDLAAVRHVVYSLMRPGISPSKVYVHDWQKGDLAIFYNRGVWHSVLGQNVGTRLMHQCNLASPLPVA